MKRLCLLFLTLGLMAFQEDPHKGQPESCNNYLKNAHKCDCHKATKCKHERPEGEDSKCQTYCRKEACRCIDPCDT